MVDPIAHDFETAGAQVMEHLQQRFGYGLWMITRRDGDDLITLQAEGDAFSAKPGMVSKWTDSLCYRMSESKQPRVAPNLAHEPDLREAPAAKALDLKAYIGVPLTTDDGAMFGSLCAFDGVEHAAISNEDQKLIELLASMLTSLLRYELQLTESRRLSERLALEAQSDPMTGLYNRRAWDDLLQKEEDRCRRYGHAATVVAVDLNGLKTTNDTMGHAAGDELIVRAAAALKQAARTVDVVARLGGDEFAILAIECDAQGAAALRERVNAQLGQAGVSASCGYATRIPSAGLLAACQVADELMYEEKRATRALARA